MVAKNISWNSIKTISNNKNISIQYTEDDVSKYNLCLPDSGLVYVSFIEKTDPPNVDQVDFETNFKSISNRPTDLKQSPFASKIINGKPRFY
jgi:hypothetical protein